MYAMGFDDFKRKLAKKPDYPFKLVAEQTCIKGTDIWQDWYRKFAKPDSDLHMSIEPDGSTYTFYRIVAKDEQTNV